MLDLIAHPIALWALGLLGSLGRTLVRKHEETGRRALPWDWAAAHPGRAASAIAASLIALAVLQSAGLLDGDGIMPALLALGAGVIGMESPGLVLDKAGQAVRRVMAKVSKS